MGKFNLDADIDEFIEQKKPTTTPKTNSGASRQTTKPEVEEEKVVKEPKKTNKENQKNENISSAKLEDILIKNKKEKGRQMAFYAKAENAAYIKGICEKTGKNVSDVINTIISMVRESS